MATILVTDDAAFMRMMLTNIFVGEADNGKSAVEKYHFLNPDLVLMDITMPEMDGVQAVKEIKRIDPSANIIMCSAMGQQGMVVDSIQAGAKDFIVKPFNEERVLEAVKKIVG
jgi:two-component system chemotaxis response regulator CheY